MEVGGGRRLGRGRGGGRGGGVTAAGGGGGVRRGADQVGSPYDSLIMEKISKINLTSRFLVGAGL